jgi:hypothetical protein
MDLDNGAEHDSCKTRADRGRLRQVLGLTTTGANHRNLKEILKSKSISTSHFKSLQEAVLVVINSGKLIVVSKKLERYYQEEFFDQVILFISNTQEEIKQKKISPCSIH